MKRITFLAALVTVGSLSLGVAAFQQPPAGAAAPKVVEVEKLRDNLWMLKGGGGNTAVFVRTDGITVVDTKNPGWGQPILDQIKKISDKPITTIINTHTHGDHVSGNVEFPASVEIIVQENTKANMQEMRAVTGIAPPAGGPAPNIFKANNGKGLPTKTFKDKMTIGKGPDEVNLFYFGRGHTNGDAWVVFPALRLAHAGDIFSGKNLPLLDANNGGSGVAIGDTLAKAAKSLKNIDTIITGHSTTMTMADLNEYAEFNKDFMKEVQAGKKAGKSADDIANGWKMPEKYKGYAVPAGPGLARLKANVQIVMDETK
jgi:glyoxylase-like metal-dependent hydrolase (beta-lactamase superfamily II)